MKKIAVCAAFVAMLGLTASAPAMVINEFMYNTAGGNYMIEFYNRSGGDLTVTDTPWKVWVSNGASLWRATPIHTIPVGTVIPDQGFYLLVTQDMFQTVPDAEASFTLLDPQVTNRVEAIRLTTGNASGPTTDDVIDTVLYGPNGVMMSAGELGDDNGTLALGIDTSAADVGAPAGLAGRQINTSTMVGSGLRRWLEGAPQRGTEGNGQDQNLPADFVAFETGSASPRSLSTPVTLSLFEIE